MTRKIFFIIPYLTKGGAQRVVTNLSNHFANKGFTVFILILNKCEIGYDLDSRVNFVYIIRGRNSNLWSRLANTFKTFFRIFHLIRKESPDTVVSFITSANMWSGFICTLLRVPYFVSERTVISRTLDTYNTVAKRIVRFIYRRSKQVVVPSQGMLNELKLKHGIRNVQVIRNPVTPFAPMTNAKVHTRPFILAVGRLNFVKGFDLLIDAYSRIENKETDLIIVGDGKERARLSQLISSYGLENVVFLPGRKNNIQDYYDQCSIFVLSSRNEGYPNVLIEAMSAGCASIAFDCETGPSEIIENGVNGLLVDNGNLRELTEAINLLILDSDLRDRLGQKGKLITETNSMDEIASEWENLILGQIT